MAREYKNLKCPTCVGAKRGRCCCCDSKIAPEKQGLAPNPFMDEIYDDKSFHMLCDDCAQEYRDSI